MGFYDTFIKNIQHDTEHNQRKEKKYYNRYFKTYLLKFFLDKYSGNEFIEDKKILLSMMTDFLKPYINKTQKIIRDKENYYVANDINTNTKYICFKHLCILDFDVNEYQYESKEKILEYIDNNEILNSVPYMRVETRNGYHIYFLDKPRIYNSIETMDFLLQFNGDIYYKFYCYLRGFSIRLNKKNISEKNVFNNIKLINKSKHKINSELYSLFNKQLSHIDSNNLNLSKMT